MSKAEALASRLGGHMTESLGARSAQPPAPGSARDVIPITAEDKGRTRNRNAGFMELDQIIPDPNQVRTEFNEERLEELAASIKRYGILQPLIVQWNKELAKHQIVAGERRYRAAKLAGLTEVPCIFKREGDLPETEKRRVQLTENCLREDLSPMEQAKAFTELMELEKWNAAQLAESLCISKGLVSQRLKLLTLPEPIQQEVHDGKLSGSAAYQLTKVKDPEKQRELAHKIATEGLSRDEATEVIEKTAPNSSGRKKAKVTKPGRPVTAKTFKTEKATVTVKFNKKRVSNEDVIRALEQTLEQLRAA